MIDPTWESPAKRSFIVSMRTRAGVKKGLQQVLVVKAYNEEKAKQEALRRVCKGRFKNSRNLFVFDSVEWADGTGSGAGNGSDGSGS